MKIIDEIREEIRAVYREPTGRDLNMLALVFLVGFGLIGSYFLFWKGRESGYYWMGTGIVLALLRAIPPVFRQVNRFWIGFSVFIGYFVSRAILTVVFFLVIAPTGLIMRVLGKDPMERKLDRDAASYWQPRVEPEKPGMETYERQF
jgi:hypothetical protein